MAPLNKLEDVKSILQESDRLWNLSDLKNILRQSTSRLFSTLTDKTIFVDTESKTMVDDIRNLLSAGGDTETKLRTKIDLLVDDWNDATTVAEKRPIKQEIDKFTAVAWWHTPQVGGVMSYTGVDRAKLNTREAEYSDIWAKQDSFNITGTAGWPFDNTIWTASGAIIDVSPGWFNCTPPGNAFAFFNNEWKKISSFWWKYKFMMEMMDWSQSEVIVEGISINNTTPPPHSIDFTHNLKFTPNNVDFSKPLKLKLWWIYENVSGSWINVVHTKDIEINITNPDLLSSSADRETEFESYNVAWWWTRIKDHLQTRNDLDLNKLERQSIERAVKDWDGPKYEQLSEDQKEQFYQQIRQLEHPTAVPRVKFFAEVERVWTFDDYGAFKSWFSHEDREWNKWETISSKAKYRDFIHNNLETKSTEYISSQLDDEILKKHDINTFVKSELTRYLDDIEKNKVDSDIHEDVDSDLGADKHKMKEYWRSMLTPKDQNYMRFFSWSSISLENQKVNIDTNTEPENINNPTPVTYKMDLEVGSTNRTSVSIDIEWERKPIQVKAWDPTSLVRSVMKNQKIPHGKVRAHIAFNIYKAMIQMAKSKDISLNYRNTADNHLNEIDIDKDWKVVVYDLDDWTNRGGNTKRITEVLFDQKMFENTNDFNGSLRAWIENISSHFNFAMNDVHKNYRKATKKRLRGMIKSPSRPKMPSSIWLSPIKKMMNMWTNTNFDFDTTVDSNGKKISINFHKNKFTVNAEWLDKPIESRDLWKILNKRKQRKRIFDGMERDIVEWVYTAMIEKLRTNSKIARSNFGVTDEITWNMYILDSDWELGMVTKEKLSQPDWNPLGRKSKKHWTIKASKLLTSWYEKLDESETKELLKNPFLMQKMMKVMNKRMWFWASMKAIFVK